MHLSFSNVPELIYDRLIPEASNIDSPLLQKIISINCSKDLKDLLELENEVFTCESQDKLTRTLTILLYESCCFQVSLYSNPFNSEMLEFSIDKLWNISKKCPYFIREDSIREIIHRIVYVITKNDIEESPQKWLAQINRLKSMMFYVLDDELAELASKNFKYKYKNIKWNLKIISAFEWVGLAIPLTKRSKLKEAFAFFSKIFKENEIIKKSSWYKKEKFLGWFSNMDQSPTTVIVAKLAFEIYLPLSEYLNNEDLYDKNWFKIERDLFLNYLGNYPNEIRIALNDAMKKYKKYKQSSQKYKDENFHKIQKILSKIIIDDPEIYLDFQMLGIFKLFKPLKFYPKLISSQKEIRYGIILHLNEFSAPEVKVRKAKIITNQKEVAVKTYSCKNRDLLYKFQKERDILHMLSGKHKVFLKFYGSFWSKININNEIIYSFSIVMQLCEKSLQYDIENSVNYSEIKCCNTIGKILEGFTILERMEVYHHDIKPHNILITKTGNPKIADFGITILGLKWNSAYSQSKDDLLKGTTYYISPELAEARENLKKKPNLKITINPRYADIYSLGLVLSQIWKLKLLHSKNDQNFHELILKMLNKNYWERLGMYSVYFLFFNFLGKDRPDSVENLSSFEAEEFNQENNFDFPKKYNYMDRIFSNCIYKSPPEIWGNFKKEIIISGTLISDKKDVGAIILSNPNHMELIPYEKEAQTWLKISKENNKTILLAFKLLHINDDQEMLSKLVMVTEKMKNNSLYDEIFIRDLIEQKYSENEILKFLCEPFMKDFLKVLKNADINLNNDFTKSFMETENGFKLVPFIRNEIEAFYNLSENREISNFISLGKMIYSMATLKFDYHDFITEIETFAENLIHSHRRKELLLKFEEILIKFIGEISLNDYILF
ncbi:unnamed protein product [Blepharisma stoltei]|uniref:Protein kinase domain-containing protein n=1 Tax=Blepharisma stoltei TaxID=1481888 RepID=A0AAU9IPY1_9CILI|nr:unnamed protein product [Blepharisma stoltei]